MYGCQNNAQGGDSEAWMVTTKTDKPGKEWIKTKLYAPWTAACPSDIESKHWWYLMKGKRGKYSDSNRYFIKGIFLGNNNNLTLNFSVNLEWRLCVIPGVRLTSYPLSLNLVLRLLLQHSPVRLLAGPCGALLKTRGIGRGVGCG